jgi:hypothetical protein
VQEALTNVSRHAGRACTLVAQWNGTAWGQVASPNNGSTSILRATSATPGASTVWAVGSSGVCCTENPLVLQNG